jgi:hypothetical protein
MWLLIQPHTIKTIGNRLNKRSPMFFKSTNKQEQRNKSQEQRSYKVCQVYQVYKVVKL